MKLGQLLALLGGARSHSRRRSRIADMQGPASPAAGRSAIAVKPDPSKVVVPDGYKVGVFVEGLDTPSSATVDKDGNVWVAVSPPLLGGPDRTVDDAHVKVFDKHGKLIKEIGKGTFTTRDERDRLLRRERQDLHSGVRREDLGDQRGRRRAQADRQGPVPSATTATAASPARTAISISPWACRAIPASPIPTITAGPTSPTTRSGSAHTDGLGTTPHDPACRDIVHTGLNVRRATAA